MIKCRPKAIRKVLKNVFLHFIRSKKQLGLIIIRIVELLGWKMQVSVNKRYNEQFQ